MIVTFIADENLTKLSFVYFTWSFCCSFTSLLIFSRYRACRILIYNLCCIYFLILKFRPEVLELLLLPNISLPKHFLWKQRTLSLKSIKLLFIFINLNVILAAILDLAVVIYLFIWVFKKHLRKVEKMATVTELIRSGLYCFGIRIKKFCIPFIGWGQTIYGSIS